MACTLVIYVAEATLLENLADWFPVVIGHIDGEFRVVDIQPIILVPDEAPVEAVFGGVGFERIELIFNLRIDIFVLIFFKSST